VSVCLPKAVDDPIGRIYLPAGSYTVKGEQALDYVRVRHSIGTTDTGDIGRMKRQQTFLAAMANKALEARTLFNPKRLYDFLNAATSSLTTDRGLHKLTEMASLANQVKGIGLDRVQFLSMPFESYAPDPNRLQAAPDAPRLWRLLNKDVRLPRKFTGDAAKASDKTPKPGQSPKPGTNPTKAAEAAKVGLCA
jgi:anionic cell wall polymer biosynthesis LytR-Cps2A-Psr (LCP) family protein